jgi:hypothetical protein
MVCNSLDLTHCLNQTPVRSAQFKQQTTWRPAYRSVRSWWSVTSKQNRLKQPRVIRATVFAAQQQQTCDVEVCGTVQSGSICEHRNASAGRLLLTKTRIAEVRVECSPRKLLRKLAHRTAVVAKQRKHCNCFHTTCMLFSSCYHRSVKNDDIAVSGGLQCGG